MIASLLASGGPEPLITEDGLRGIRPNPAIFDPRSLQTLPDLAAWLVPSEGKTP